MRDTDCLTTKLSYAFLFVNITWFYTINLQTIQWKYTTWCTVGRASTHQVTGQIFPLLSQDVEMFLSFFDPPAPIHCHDTDTSMVTSTCPQTSQKLLPLPRSLLKLPDYLTYMSLWCPLTSTSLPSSVSETVSHQTTHYGTLLCQDASPTPVQHINLNAWQPPYDLGPVDQ